MGDMKGSDAADQKLSEAVKGNLLAFKEAREDAAATLMDLTPMQRQYCEARLSGMIPLHAARHAGYANVEVNAYRVEKHPAVQKALTNARRMVIERFDLNRNDVLRGLMDAVQASGNATELVAAWREIGRIVGVYEPTKVEITHKVDDVTLDKLQSLSTKDLIELAKGRDFEVLSEEDPFADEYAAIQDAMKHPRPEGLVRYYEDLHDGDDGTDSSGDDGDDGDLTDDADEDVPGLRGDEAGSP